MKKISIEDDITTTGFESVEFLPELKEILNTGMNRLTGLEASNTSLIMPKGVEVIEYNPTLDLGLKDVLTPSVNVSLTLKSVLKEKFEEYFEKELSELESTEQTSLSGHKLTQFLLASSLGFEVRATSSFPLQAHIMKDKAYRSAEEIREMMEKLSEEEKIKISLLAQIEKVAQNTLFLDGSIGEFSVLLPLFGKEKEFVFEIDKGYLTKSQEDIDSSLIGKSLSSRMIIDLEVPFDRHPAAELYFSLVQTYYLSLFHDVCALVAGSFFGTVTE